MENILTLGAQCTTSCTLKETVGREAVVGIEAGLSPSSRPLPSPSCHGPCPLSASSPASADGAGPTRTRWWHGVIGASARSECERGHCQQQVQAPGRTTAHRSKEFLVTTRGSPHDSIRHPALVWCPDSPAPPSRHGRRPPCPA